MAATVADRARDVVKSYRVASVVALRGDDARNVVETKTWSRSR